MIFLILLLLNATDFRVAMINIEGNEYFKDGKIKSIMLTKTPGIFNRGKFLNEVFKGDITAIKNLYDYNGFLETQVLHELAFDSTRTSVNINIRIEEGTQTSVKETYFSGNKLLTSDFLKNKSVVKLGEPFDKRKIDIDNYIITSIYDDLGYADVNVKSTYRIENHQAIISHDIVEGDKQFIKEIELLGLNRTREDVVMKEIGLKSLDILRYAKILNAQRDLYNLGVFKSIRTQVINAPEPDRKIVQFMLAEKAPIMFNFRIGYGTQDYLRLGAGITHLNMLGRAWRGDIEGKVSFAEYRLNSSLTVPHFLILPVKTTFGLFYQYKKEIGFDVRNRGGYVTTQFDFLGGKFSTKYEIENIRTYFLDIDSIEDDWLHGLTLNWLRDRRNDPFFSTRGDYINIILEASGIVMPADVNYLKPAFQYRTFSPIAIFVSATSLKTGIAQEVSPSTEVPVYKRFFCGGTSSVRGYAEWSIGPKDEFGNPLGGKILFEVSQALCFPIYKLLGGAVFLDGGNVWSDYDEVTVHLRWGVGAGLRFRTPLGNLRLDYGMKLNRQEDESFGVLHFAIGEAF